MKKFLSLLFFLIISFNLTPWFEDQSFYFFLNRSSFYTPAFFCFWLISAGIFTFLYNLILKNLPLDSSKNLFNGTVFLLGGAYALFFIYIPIISASWQFKGCGKEFNRAFEEAVKSEADSFCYDLNKIKMNS